MNRWLPTRLVFFVVLAFMLVSAQDPEKKQDPPPDFSVALNVDLVLLHASVFDRSRTPVPGLNKEDFRVFENGVPQTIKFFQREDIPVTLGLVVDRSTSMVPKRAQVVAASLALARASHPADEIFVVNFNERAHLGLPPEIPFTSRIQDLEPALTTRADGRTALYDALALALDHLEKGKWGKKVLVLVSDGSDNSSRSDFAGVLEQARRSEAIIYTIGIFDESGKDHNPGLLRKLARVTGGDYFFPRELSHLDRICRRIASDVRNQYILGYVPPVSETGAVYRTVRVTAAAPGSTKKLFVRTRDGYFAPSAPPTVSSEPPEVRPEVKPEVKQ